MVPLHGFSQLIRQSHPSHPDSPLPLSALRSAQIPILVFLQCLLFALYLRLRQHIMFYQSLPLPHHNPFSLPHSHFALYNDTCRIQQVANTINQAALEIPPSRYSPFKCTTHRYSSLKGCILPNRIPRPQTNPLWDRAVGFLGFGELLLRAEGFVALFEREEVSIGYWQRSRG